MVESRGQKRKKRKKLKEPQRIAEALPESLNRLGHKSYDAWIKLYNEWERIVGTNIAERTRPRKLKAGLLIVQTTSAVWKNELTFLKQRLISQINTFLDQDAVKDIKVTHGQEKLPDMYVPPPKPQQSRPPTADEIAESKQIAEAIHDPELREDFENLLQKHLVRKPPSQ